jgi:predicted MFS family arabinose efflux permease
MTCLRTLAKWVGQACFIWGFIPLAAQVWMLRAVPDAQEAASAVNVSDMQISIAIGSAVGGLLVDNVGLASVYVAGGSIAFSASSPPANPSSSRPSTS